MVLLFLYRFPSHYSGSGCFECLKYFVVNLLTECLKVKAFMNVKHPLLLGDYASDTYFWPLPVRNGFVPAELKFREIGFQRSRSFVGCKWLVSIHVVYFVMWELWLTTTLYLSQNVFLLFSCHPTGQLCQGGPVIEVCSTAFMEFTLIILYKLVMIEWVMLLNQRFGRKISRLSDFFFFVCSVMFS